jgi:subtilisin-like proprotein convertase family protein
MRSQKIISQLLSVAGNEISLPAARRIAEHFEQWLTVPGTWDALRVGLLAAHKPQPGPESAVLLSPRPTDTNFTSQWYLGGSQPGNINLRTVWDDFTGRGVTVAVVDDGFDVLHSDLRANYNASLDRDWRTGDANATIEVGDRHGTAVMGVIGGDLNGTGIVGTAHGATVAGLRVGFGANGTAAQFADALRDGARFDISNNSWAYTTHFQDNFDNWVFSANDTAMAFAAATGRGGLGTIQVFAAGNTRSSGDNVNHHNHQNSIFAATVAATDSSGRIAGFSSPGAALLVAAPGQSITTADNTGSTGYSAGDIVSVSGTSFAAPIISGVVAMMLEANAALGWRDVHEILAYSARHNDPARASWQFNEADDFNGGGLRTSTDYGFGLVDAHAAVRLAETWTLQSTSANMRTLTASTTPNSALTDLGVTTSTLSIAQDLRIDRIEVELDLRHTWRGDLRISLVSPEGTESFLIDRPGVVPNGTSAGSSLDDIVFDLTSTQFWSESGRGTWTLKVQDVKAGDTGTLVSWRLNLYGDTPTANNTYVYTDAFATLGAEAARQLLSDLSGLDSINASAVTTASTIDLLTGATIAGRAVSFAPGTVIERAYGGDGADTIAGNSAANTIWGGRGDDVLSGRGGADSFVFGLRSGNDRILDFDVADRLVFEDGVAIASTLGNIAYLTNGGSITAENGWLWQAVATPVGVI